MIHAAVREKTGISTPLALMFAVVAGLAVGNLYWAQPLLAIIADDLGVQNSQGGLLITATQAGYALGILLLVPLGDVMERRRLLLVVMFMTVTALALCALSPSFGMLCLTLGVLGVVTVSGQIILPLAGDLATAQSRGRIVGIVSSGITAGILFSRLLSGVVADLWGWRSIFLLASGLNLLLTGIVFRTLPEVPTYAKIPYGRLLLSVFTTVRRYPALKSILFKQGMIFGITFNLFWTALTFLLAERPFNYSPFQIGLTSLAGLTGALAGTRLGALEDKGWGSGGMTCFIVLTMLCMLTAAFSGTSIGMLILIASLFSLSVQGVGILCQARLFALTDTERSRLNTAFVVSNFIFCALGSSLAALLWQLGGWTAVSLGGFAAASLALGAHTVGNRLRVWRKAARARP